MNTEELEPEEPVPPKRLRGRPRAPELDIILTAAAELFEQKGFQRTTMQDVADRIGIAKPTLYVHARSKLALLEGIFERFVRDGEVVLDEASELPDPAERIRAILYGWMRTAVAIRSHYMLFFDHQRELPPRAARHYRRWSADFFATIREMIVDGQRAGVFRSDIDPTVLAFGLTAIPNWTARWFSPDGAMSVDDVADQYWQLLGHGFLVPEEQDVAERRRARRSAAGDSSR